MDYWIILLAWSFALPGTSSKTISYLDNYGNGLIAYDTSPEKMDRYATLANDPIGDLTNDFTICSASYVEYRSSLASFFNLYQSDGSPWINFYQASSHVADMTERYTIVFNETMMNLLPNNVSAVPHSWYRGCVGVDTVSGRIRIYVDGAKLVDKEIDYFKNSMNTKPKSLMDRLGVFKCRLPGLYYNARGRISNMQVHSKLLSVEEMIHTTSNNNPDCIVEGDYLSWSDMEWEKTGEVIEKEFDVEDLCESKESNKVVLDAVFTTWISCMQMCPKMAGSRAPAIMNQKDFDHINTNIRKLVFGAKESTRTLFTFWLPVSDIKEEGKFVDYYSKNATSLNFPSSGRLENCGICWLQTPPRLDDWTCIIPPNEPLRCVCEHPKRIYLRLRGLCKTSMIDPIYSPSADRVTGNFLMLGTKTTKIEYDSGSFSWNLRVYGIRQATAASSKAPKISYLLGKHFWSIEEDDKGCSDLGVPYGRFLKLSGCEDDAFTCNDGQCISMVERCDQVLDCRDGSDENDCTLLIIDGGYNKKVAPFSVNTETKEFVAARVNISIDLLNVIEISEQNHKITFKFGISLEWYENRALYHNLKEEESFNVFNEEEIKKVWTPYVIYKNTDNNEAVTVNDGLKTTIAVTREGGFSRSDMSMVDEIEIFNGKGNRITMNQTYSKEFQCTYLIHWFPFDTQVCYIHMILPAFDLKTVMLVPDQFIMSSDTELTQYFIKDWSLAYIDKDNSNLGIKMQIIFKRRLTNEILTTYLPTILLIFIGYCTTFFKQFFFEAALTVNLTVMLVVTTIFISVMEKLPPTSYVRMVDIWLIFGIIIPFLEVSILTFKEFNNVEEEQEINHHGHARKVVIPQEIDVTAVQPLSVNMKIDNYISKEETKISKKALIKYASLIEQKIIPGMTLAFFTIYWFIGLLAFNDLYMTYQS